MMMFKSAFLRKSLCLLLGSVVVSCAESSFTKSNQKKSTDATIETIEPLPGEQAEAPSPEAIPAEQVAADGPAETGGMPALPALAAVDKSALDECLKGWTKPPFTAEQIAKPTIVNINEGVNNNAVLYSDTLLTVAPTLYLINFNANIGNQGVLELKNPRGWYCINFKAKVVNNFEINLACTTQSMNIGLETRNANNFQTLRDVCP